MDPLIADLEQRVKTGDANDTWALGFSSGSMVFQRSAILCPMTAKAIARTNHTEKVRGILLMMQNYRLLEDDKAIPTCDPIRQGCYAFGLYSRMLIFGLTTLTAGFVFLFVQRPWALLFLGQGLKGLIKDP